MFLIVFLKIVQTATIAALTTKKYCQQTCLESASSGGGISCCQTPNCNSGVPSYIASSTSSVFSLFSNVIALIVGLVSICIYL